MRLPVVMYHQIGEPPASVRHPSNFVRPEAFSAQLEMLDRDGYEPITLEQWVAARRGGATLPGKPIVLTFDDAYQSVADIAWPILAQHGWTATIFAVAGLLGRTNTWDVDEVTMPLCSADTLRDLMLAGNSVGAHSHTHRPLAKIARNDAIAELRNARQTLERALGRPVTTMAWPFNNQRRAVRLLAREAGYVAAVRGRGRVNSRFTDPLALYRVKADLTTSLATLRDAITRHHLLPW
jgi:peptidoglycan/xylan/chitin deacetylase (PgdA/CDA1 family)